MSLNFDPTPYLEAFRAKQAITPTGSQIAGQIGQGIGDIGDTMLQMAQNARQNRAQTLQTGLSAASQGFDPQKMMAFLNNKPLPQTSNGMGQTQTDYSSLLPNFQSSQNQASPQQPPAPMLQRPGAGQMASAGMPDTGYSPSPMPSPIPGANISTGQPGQATSMMPPATGGLHTQSPWSSSVAPAMGQSQGAGQSQGGGLFDRAPMGNLSGIKVGSAEWYALPSYQRDLVAKGGEFAQREADRQTQIENTKVYRDFLMANRNLNVGTKEDQQQDKLEQQARQAVTNLRGDKSLARTEEQRDAAAVAFNRISEIQKSGGQLNPIDYTDILGQIYKARTGSAPTEQVLNEIRQATAKGSFGKAFTYVTGQQAPATTENITASLQQMAQSMGNQADQFHDGYMKAHLIKPTGLNDDRWQPILTTGRGMSFKEATQQYQQGSQGGGQSHPQDNAAIQWAQQNPNDPRAQKILQLNGAR